MARSQDLFSGIGELVAVAEVETVRDPISLFETVGMPARNLSARTRTKYSRDLKGLAPFLDEREVERLGDVSLRLLDAFQAAMDAEGNRTATRTRKSYAVKTFFTFLFKHGMTEDDVAARRLDRGYWLNSSLARPS